MSLQAKMKRNHKARDKRDREILNAVMAGHAAMAGAINAERSATKEVSTLAYRRLLAYVFSAYREICGC